MTAEPRTALSVDRPFPGLRPYAFEDSAFYFGREDQIYSLYRLLDRSHFIAVVGSSGSGKSSLVRAGLLPLLDAETKNAGGHSWRWVEMRPAGAPLKRLTEALASLMPEAEDDVGRAINAARRERIGFALRQSSFGLAEALDKIEGLGDSSFVLVVDQFEELFRYAASTTGQKGGPGTEALWREDAAHFVQLLLEISRSRTRAVHVVITMRSDFIGDCARFHGLPEAVSATQFLVPSLTRDQREEVIRKPIEKAGATIEPTLVERLLNDAGDELDQLPVVQHCLMRLWDRAGTDAKLSSSAEPDSNIAEPHPTARHLTIEHYQAIGTIASALSQHAEEILASLSGLELAVEQVFRALAEVDRAGRAIRRAVAFAQLIAETGIPEDELRKVVDRLRADDCSFLVPSPSSVPELAPDTPIDVGHEALLRRWERLSGDPVIPAQGASATQQTGWLRAEDGDGRLYRGLLAFVDSEGGEGTTLPLDQVERRWKWWTSHPRTEAWAERYGGGFASVTRLFENSLAALEATRQAAERAAIALREQERSHAERLLREQIQRSRLRFAWSVVGLLVMFALLGFLTDRFVMPVRDRVKAITNYAQQDSTDDFRLRLLLLTAAIRMSDEWPAWIVDNQSMKDKLRETLLRSPIFGGTFDAAGTDAEGRRIVTLAKNRLIVRDLLTGTESKPVTVPQTGAENEPMEPFVGLVTLSNGSQVAVVFRTRSGKLFVGEPGTRVLDTRFHLPEEFRAAGMVPPMAVVLGGRLIFIGLHFSEGLLDQELVLNPQELVLNPRIKFMEGPQFEVSRTSSYWVDWDSTKRTARRLPILAEDCEAYAFLGRRENESNESLAQFVLWSAKLSIQLQAPPRFQASLKSLRSRGPRLHLRESAEPYLCGTQSATCRLLG